MQNKFLVFVLLILIIVSCSIFEVKKKVIRASGQASIDSIVYFQSNKFKIVTISKKNISPIAVKSLVLFENGSIHNVNTKEIQEEYDFFRSILDESHEKFWDLYINMIYAQDLTNQPNLKFKTININDSLLLLVSNYHDSLKFFKKTKSIILINKFVQPMD